MFALGALPRRRPQIHVLSGNYKYIYGIGVVFCWPSIMSSRKIKLKRVKKMSSKR